MSSDCRVFHEHLVSEADLSAVRAEIPCRDEADGVVPGMTISLYRWTVAGEREPRFVLVYEDGARAVFRLAGRVEWGSIQVDRKRDGSETVFVLTDHPDPKTAEREAIILERTAPRPQAAAAAPEATAGSDLDGLARFPDALLGEVRRLDAAGQTQEAVDLAFRVMERASARHSRTIVWLALLCQRAGFSFRDVGLRLIALAERYAADSLDLAGVSVLNTLLLAGAPLAEAYLTMARLLRGRLWDARRRAQFRAAAERFERAGDLEAARAIRQVTPDDPEDDFVSAEREAAEEQAKAGRNELAALHLRAALDRRPADRSLAHELVRALQEAGRDAEALGVKYALAAAVRARGDAAGADAEEAEAARLDPARPELWLERARRHLGALETERAVDALRTALERDPRCVDALLLLGRIGHWTGIGERPEVVRERLFAIDPERARAFSAECLRAEGKPRVVRFPEDGSLGSLSGRDRAGLGPAWPLGPARGTVRVPAGANIALHCGTHATLSALSSLGPDDIQSLSFGETPVRDADLRHLSGLHGLRHLDLGGSDVACSGFLENPMQANGLRLDELAGFFEDGYGVTDRGLACLRDLTRLESLDLSTWGGNDAALAQLRPLRSLQRLRLHGATVCGPGLRHLAALPALRELDLRASRVTRAALHHLAALPRLERVLLLARQWNEADAARLQELAGRAIEVVREDPAAPEVPTLAAAK